MAETVAEWTAEELAKANTAANVTAMTEQEREAVKYINLARLYPQKFAETEVADYYGDKEHGFRYRLSDYRLTLIAELMTMSPREALTFDNALLEDARCLAAEQSRNGEVGHLRHACKENHGAECCAYGYNVGRIIALQLLIDDGVEGVGHRSALLNAGLATVGVAINSHPSYQYCAIVDLGWGDDSKDADVRYKEISNVPAEEARRSFAMMTHGLDRDLVSHFSSGTPVVDVQEKTHTTTTSDGSFIQVKRETRVHADGKKQIIETTTTMKPNGTSTSKRRVWVE